MMTTQLVETCSHS